MNLPRDLVVTALRQPDRLLDWPLPAWDRLIRQARRADLLARIGLALAQRQLLARVPPSPRAHIEAALQVARAQHEQVRREVAHIAAALALLGIEPILLKGSAYLLAGLPAAAGRLFADIDILVPASRLPEIEAGLMLQGWATTHHTPYDQKYYRLWMHELPPMVHIHRHTVLDVHHAILPRTARLKPDPARLIAASQPVPGAPAEGEAAGGAAAPAVRILAPADMVLHSMTHLFHNEELSHGLRDLSDVDLLLRHFAADPAFWPQLVVRARELDLARPLHYGLRYARRTFDTPVPDAVLAHAAAAAPAAWLGALMDGLWTRGLAAPHKSASDRYRSPALALLYLRAHWLRMPPWALARHLTIKAFRRRETDPATRAVAP